MGHVVVQNWVCSCTEFYGELLKADIRVECSILHFGARRRPSLRTASTSALRTRTKPLPRQWRLLRVACADFGRVHFEI